MEQLYQTLAPNLSKLQKIQQKCDKTSQIPDKASKNDISNLLYQISKSVTDSNHQIEEAMVYFVLQPIFPGLIDVPTTWSIINKLVKKSEISNKPNLITPILISAIKQDWEDENLEPILELLENLTIQTQDKNVLAIVVQKCLNISDDKKFCKESRSAAVRFLGGIGKSYIDFVPGIISFLIKVLTDKKLNSGLRCDCLKTVEHFLKSEVEISAENLLNICISLSNVHMPAGFKTDQLEISNSVLMNLKTVFDEILDRKLKLPAIDNEQMKSMDSPELQIFNCWMTTAYLTWKIEPERNQFENQSGNKSKNEFINLIKNPETLSKIAATHFQHMFTSKTAQNFPVTLMNAYLQLIPSEINNSMRSLETCDEFIKILKNKLVLSSHKYSFDGDKTRLEIQNLCGNLGGKCGILDVEASLNFLTVLMEWLEEFEGSESDFGGLSDFGDLVLWLKFEDEIYENYGDVLEVLFEKRDYFIKQGCSRVYREVLVHFCRNEEDLQDALFELLTIDTREVAMISEFSGGVEPALDPVLDGLLAELGVKYGCDDILKKNIDYVSQSISLQIMTNIQKSALAFTKIIEHTDESMIIYFEDMCDKFIHVLTAAPTLQNLQIILPLLQQLAGKLELWYNNDLTPNLKLQEFYNDLFDTKHVLSVDELLKLDENLQTIDKKFSLKPADQEDHVPTAYQRISEKIVNKLIVSISLVISSNSRIGLNHVLKSVKSCLNCLSNSPKLLNLIHQLWQPLITCFSKTRDLHLLRICVDMTLLFTNYGRDFMKQRTQPFLDHISNILSKYTTGTGDKSDFNFTSEFRLICNLIQVLPKLVFQLAVKNEATVLKILQSLKFLVEKNKNNEIGLFSREAVDKFRVLQVPIVNCGVVLDVVWYGHLVTAMENKSDRSKKKLKK